MKTALTGGGCGLERWCVWGVGVHGWEVMGCFFTSKGCKVVDIAMVPKDHCGCGGSFCTIIRGSCL